MIRQKVLQSNVVAITKNSDEKTALRDALNLLPFKGVIKSDFIVTITANLVNLNPPEKGVVVGQETLRELIRIIKEENPKRIVLAAGSGGANTNEVLNKFGFSEVINSEGIEFVDLNIGEFKDLYLGHDIISTTKVNKLLFETNFLISFTQLKLHEEATMSASIKNIALSWPPASVHGYPKKNLGIHEDLHGFIYSFAKNVPIDLSIVSLNPAMIGTGPSKGKAVHSEFLMAGFDAVSVDTIAARLLGFRPQAINYLFRLIKDNIGVGNIEDIDIKGIKLIDAEKQFSSIAYGHEFAIDE
nr:DUF362 domain-containing protein [Caloramator mitchellensis]